MSGQPFSRLIRLSREETAAKKHSEVYFHGEPLTTGIIYRLVDNAFPFWSSFISPKCPYPLSHQVCQAAISFAELSAESTYMLDFLVVSICTKWGKMVAGRVNTEADE